MKIQGDTIMEVVAIVGMAGAGKSEAARLFEEGGFQRIRFGDITDAEVRKQGLELNEKNERIIREQVRTNYGMAAYAIVNLPRIEMALEKSPVVIDGLYSWEEYTFLNNNYENRFGIVAIWASPKTRYARLAGRSVRPLTAQEAASRDEAEIKKINKGGPIAMADFMVLNEAALADLEREVKKVISVLRGQD
jgi:dephospho-CoA kinase